MSLTYIDLVNRVLVRLNEAPLTTDTFNNTRNIQTAVKNAVKETVAKINRTYPEWPYFAKTASVTLVPGQQDYPWPDDFSSVDWNSFSIAKNDTLNVNTQELVRVDRDQWYLYSKERDLNQALGIRVPRVVFESHSYGFSVSPSPDKAYTISYDYYMKPIDLNQATDETLIPEDFAYVVVAGAMVDVYAFKENLEAAAFIKGQFNEGMMDMRRIFGQQRTYVSDHRIPRHNSTYWRP